MFLVTGGGRGGGGGLKYNLFLHPFVTHFEFVLGSDLGPFSLLVLSYKGIVGTPSEWV